MIRFALCLCLIVAACPAADLYHVAGTVINARTNQPVQHAQVYFYKSGTPIPRAPFISGTDGKFSFDVPEGKYVMQAGTRNILESYGEQSQENGFSSGVITGPSQDTSTLVFRWYPTAAISGRIVDESGEPAEGALVQLIWSSVTRGHTIVRTLRWAYTDDRGEYRFGSMHGGGRYYLAVTGTPWYESQNRVLAGPADSRPSVAFVPVFYPNTSNAAQAAPIVVAPGEEARADFALTPAAGATVSVTVTGSDNLTGTLALTRDGIGATDSFQKSQNITLNPALRQQQNALGPALQQQKQMISGVPPGHYVMSVTGKSGSSYLAGRTAIDVNGLDVNLEIPLQPVSTLSGTLQLANPSMRPAGTMFIALSPDSGAASRSASVKPDGTFTFPAVGRGAYRIGVGGMAGFVSKLEVTGADYRDGLLTVTEGETIKAAVTFSNETGIIAGFAMNGDKSAPAVLVVFAPAEESRNPSKYHGYQTESDGSFNYTNVPAGDYNVFAVEDTAFEFANADAVRPYLAGAKKITVAPHQTLTDQHISLTSAK